MDTDQEDTRLTELREALRRLPSAPGTVVSSTTECMKSDQLSCDISWSWSDQLSALTTASISTITTDQIVALDWSSIGTSSAPYIIPSSLNDLNVGTVGHAKIELRGDDADIEINGESVVGMLREIRDRLAILQVSEEMEAEWDELRALRKQYEAKLAECREKSSSWQVLKK